MHRMPAFPMHRDGRSNVFGHRIRRDPTNIAQNIHADKCASAHPECCIPTIASHRHRSIEQFLLVHHTITQNIMFKGILVVEVLGCLHHGHLCVIEIADGV